MCVVCRYRVLGDYVSCSYATYFLIIFIEIKAWETTDAFSILVICNMHLLFRRVSYMLYLVGQPRLCRTVAVGQWACWWPVWGWCYSMACSPVHAPRRYLHTISHILSKMTNPVLGLRIQVLYSIIVAMYKIVLLYTLLSGFYFSPFR